MQTETDGIVLRQVKTVGGRTMVLLFSQKYGKISVGTGISDYNSKTKASLLIKPFTYGRYELYKGKETYNLNGGDVKKSFYSFGQDLDKYISASYALELTEKVLQPELPEPRLFSVLLDYLKELAERKTAYDTLLLAYETKLLNIVGSSPNLDECACCGKDERAVFSIREGGMICSDCAKKITENLHSEPSLRLIYAPKFDIVNTLKYFETQPLSTFRNIALDQEVSDGIKVLLREYISYYLEIGPLKSESML